MTEKTSSPKALQEKKNRLASLLKRRLAETPPLSYGQEALWFEQQLAPEEPIYHIATALRIQSPVDVRALQQATTRLLDRHGQLRTRFPDRAGQPQALTEPSTISGVFQSIDLNGASEGERQRLVNRDAQIPFDLAKGPLIRLHLYSCSPTDHVLLLVIHHMVVDGWSLWLLLDELQSTYASIIEGRPEARRPSSIDFGDFASWQRRFIASEKGEQLSAFWREKMAGDWRPLDLPFSRPRPAKLTYRGAAETFRFTQDEVLELRRLAQGEGVTPVSLLLAAFQILLFRYTEQDNFLVGLASAGRGHTEFANTVGYFVNLLPIRAQMAASEPFRVYLQRVHKQVQQVLAHQDYPLSLIVRDRNAERDPSRPTLFETAFVYQKSQRSLSLQPLIGLAEDRCFRWGHWKIMPFVLERVTSIYDLSLQLTEVGQGLSADVEYRCDLFDRETMQRLVSHYRALLSGILADPDCLISHLPLIDEEERRQLLCDWNQTRTNYPQDRGIHNLFEEEVAKSPEATAITFKNQKWRYAELNRWANQLAHYLLSQGVGPGELVGVHLPRSADFVAAVLAILKAGAAYLPLETSLPLARLSFMIADAGIKTIITDNEAVLADIDQTVARLNPHRSAAEIAACPTGNPDLKTVPLQPAYVIYTSGSSGQPKGAWIPHRALINVCVDTHARLRVRREDAWLAHSSTAFDASVMEIFLPLMAGASIHIVGHPDGMDGYRLAEEIQTSKANLTVSTPSFWRLVLAGSWQGKPGVRGVCGGETMSRTLADQVMAKGVEIHNVYGNTETAIICTDQKVVAGPGIVPVGRPMANSRIYILDGEMQPTPIGVPGEIHIGGVQLGLGYINRPGLTASYFVPDPFTAEPGARMYRTGDLGRFRPDGSLEYLRRLDQQVKIRGRRIEPGEVESWLNQYKAVHAAVVVIHEQEPGDPHLIAYVQAKREAAITTHELTHFLSQVLPDYMIPSVFVIMDELPLTPNGKVDRLALPAPDFEQHIRRDKYRAPRTELEGRLSGIWAELLHIDRAGIEDNFFESGGHSLLAMRLLALVEIETGCRLSMADFMADPTVRCIARLVHAARSEKREEPLLLPRAITGEAGERYPLTHGQEALWYVEQLEPDKALYHIPAAWLIKGRLNTGALERALKALTVRHELLRSRIVLGEELSWEIMPLEAFCLHREDLSRLQEGPSEPILIELVNRLSQEPFDLLDSPPVRAALIRCNTEEHVLLLVIHHIAFDGWSSSILLEELSRLYRAFDLEETPSLEEPGARFGDFAGWQRERVDRDHLNEGLAYWKGKLAGVPPLDLTHGQAGMSRKRGTGGLVPFSLPAKLVRDLTRLGQNQGVTLFATLITAFQVWLYRHTYQSEFGVGFPSAGRLQADTARTVGYFINMLVLRASIDSATSFIELLGQVRQDLLEALRHQEIPFDRVARAVPMARQGEQNPLFQVLFTFEPEQQPSLDLAGVTVSPVQDIEWLAQFDLVMNIHRLGSGLHGELRYDSQLFSPDEIERMAERFLILLKALARDADQPIGQLPILGEDERQQLLFEWNRTEGDYPRELCLHQQFEEQVFHRPEALVATFHGQRCNYGQLNRRANRLAHYLAANGLKPGDIAATHLPRSIDLLVAILAIFKAGGVYLPLDPDLPRDRLRFMINDAGARYLLVGDEGGRHLATSQIAICHLGQAADAIRTYPSHNPSLEIGSDYPAYVIYTSGSTGRPKGVVTSHRSLVNVLFEEGRLFPVVPEDVRLAHITINFEPSLVQLLSPLMFGASTYIVDEETAADGHRLARAIEDGGVTLINATPSGWSILLAAGWRGGRGIRVISGGEALTRPLAEGLLAKEVRLINAYGPTETTIMCTTQDVTHVEEPIPIGRPVTNAQIVILDDQMEPVPIGVPGEIFIGGDGLAIGYLNRPLLTAESFVPHPYSDEPGARLYRTGDLGRYQPDGSILFLGRLDQQVKIRDLRVEPGEIESLLNQHPTVEKSLVIVHNVAEDDLRLAAYVIPKDGQRMDEAVLIAGLRQNLPSYMVPAAFVELEKIPLTPNRKVDTAALPLPVWGGARQGKIPLEPRNETEKKLATIWRELLHVPEISVRDDFFELGGHSLLAMRLVHSIEEQFGRRLPLATLIKAPTIEQLAGILSGALGTDENGPLITLQEAGTAQPLFLITAGIGDWLALDRVVKNMQPSRPVFGLQPPTAFRQSLPKADLDDLLRVYETAVRTRQPEGPYLIAGYCSGGLLAYALASRLAAEGAVVDRLVLMEAPIAYPAWQHSIYRRLRPIITRFLPEKGSNWRPLRILRSLFADDGLAVHMEALNGIQAPDFPGHVALIQARWSHVRFMASAKSWRRIAKGGVKTLVVTGDHDNFLRGPRAVGLARQIDLALTDRL